ncbi:MAG TPA: hypothetical protein VE989_04665 [Sphingomicrobium sp.]|jgi:hypothetical protein|nr:hypothetical protein [Sphingomicrobium sp.]
MTRTPFILMLAAAAALAGCGKNDHTIVAGGDPADDQPSNAMANANVQLPPSIAASKTYRCKDNSIIYIDWLSDGSSRVKKSANETGTSLPAGDPSLTGNAHAGTVTYKGQSCKA